MQRLNVNYSLTNFQDRGPPRRYDDRRGGPRDRYDVSELFEPVAGLH